MNVANRVSGSFLACASALFLLVAACGDGAAPTTTAGSGTATTSEAATTTTLATTTTEGVAEGLVTSIDQLEPAIVRIVAEGSFVDPQVGLQLNAAGSGSGFIIDPSGIAVTNNHVVTGAALLRVFVGDDDEPRNARILGVSECSDLAVIDIDGDGYPYLDWFEGEVGVGTEVFAAGFPLGDPEFTLTRGIISKEEANGESTWASLDSVLEHDATINPGNSGGPLVTGDAQVVGVNYASLSDANQYFAIAHDDALSIIDRLRDGQAVESIGVNGQAVADEDLSGVWVASVESGSPADRAGIVGGDIITRLEGLVLATDGTMADYCDILRTNAPDDVLAIEVLRFADSTVLEGRLNDTPLELSFSFRQEIGDEVAGGPGPGTYTEYVAVSDDTGAISVEVPVDWFELDGVPREGFGPSIAASPDLAGFYTSWTIPGMEVAATRSLGPADVEAILDDFSASGECADSLGREDYADPLYTGRWEFFLGCGGTDSGFALVAAVPEGAGFVVIVAVQVVTEADLDALDRIFDTFVVSGDF